MAAAPPLVLNTPAEASAHLIEHPLPNDASTLMILQACAPVNTVYDVCGCNVRQKLALIRLGINTIANLRLLGKTKEKASRDSR